MANSRILSGFFALALAVGWSISSSGAQDRKGSAASPEKGSVSESKKSGRQWHFVVSAEDLIGSPVYDSKSERAGEIEYVMIEMDSGEVRHVIISSGGFLDIGDELTAIPWSALDTPVSRTAARLNVTKRELQRGLTVTEDNLADLTKPSIITQITEYWAPLTGEQAGDRKSASKTAASKAKTTASEAKQQDTGKRTESKSSRSGSENQPSAQTSKKGAEKAERGLPHVLVGRGVVTTIVAPAQQFAHELVGAEVRGKNGKELGEIDHLMIETSIGRVAYVLVSRGEFLGLGGEWVPVPFEVLSWSPESETLMLSADASTVQKMKAIGKTERPSSVRRSDLAKLYQQYQVEPFWSKNQQDKSERKPQSS